jgi:hypothetical protein
MMKASQTIPQGYREQGRISLKKKTLLIWLNVLAAPWFLCCAFFFGFTTNLLRPLNFAFMAHRFPTGTRLGAVEVFAVVLVALFITAGGVFVLHELMHGLFFWLFTKSRPVYGFKGWYAYAAAPGWYLPRMPFLAVGAAPLIFLSLLGEALVLVVPDTIALLVLWAVIVNAGGAIGDLYMIGRLLLAPRDIVIEDSGDGIKWYAPATLS